MTRDGIIYINGVCETCDILQECDTYKILDKSCRESGIAIYVTGCFVGDKTIEEKLCDGFKRPECVCESCMYNSSRKHLNCKYIKKFKSLMKFPYYYPNVSDNDRVFLPKLQGIFYVIRCDYWKRYYTPCLYWSYLMKP